MAKGRRLARAVRVRVRVRAVRVKQAGAPSGSNAQAFVPGAPDIDVLYEGVYADQSGRRGMRY